MSSIMRGMEKRFRFRRFKPYQKADESPLFENLVQKIFKVI
jgi:hypothetical protein